MEDTWFHFHCHAGQGKTGVFLSLYDKMRNPEVGGKDILYRQAMTGSHKLPLYAEKAKMMPLLLQYVEEHHGDNYRVSRSEWLRDGVRQ